MTYNTVDKEWNPDYQGRDYEVVDYQEFSLPGVGDHLRGPQPDLTPGRYFSCVGAAQTHGTFVERPYPLLLAEALGLEALNLGQPAAGPGFFADNAEILRLINQGRFLVLQVMAARMESNRYYEAVGHRETVRDRDTGELMACAEEWRRNFINRKRELPEIVQDCRESWLQNCRRLIKQIEVPIVILWISHQRKYQEPITFGQESFDEHWEILMRQFPQFVDSRCVEPLRSECADIVVCNSTRNANRQLVSRFTGEPVKLDNGLLHPDMAGTYFTHDYYYPSPEMHQDAANGLIDALRNLEKSSPGLLHTR